MRWAIVDTCSACRLNSRTLWMRFEGVVLKLSAVLDQELVPIGTDLVEPKRDEHVARIQIAISRAFSRLEGDGKGSGTCLVQSAGCPVCGLSEELSERPLSMALFSAVEEHECLAETLRQEVSDLQESDRES